MAVESWSAWGRWKASHAAVTIRWRIEQGVCGACGEHPAGTACPNLGAVWVEPEWVGEVLAYYGAVA